MKSSSNTFHHGMATLPTQINLAPPDDGRQRSISDPPLLSAPEPYQSIPAQELLKDNCGKCGWIRKEGGTIKTWRDRYVILHKGCLYYYQNSEATTTSGKFSLSGYRLSPAPERSSKYPWTFKLVHLQPEKRTYYFAAYSEREMNEWMDNITEEMEEFCGSSPKQKISESTESGDGLEYCYPEVEPRFDPEELAALFGKPSPNLPRKPAAEPMYYPPPEMEPRDPRKMSPLPRTPGHSFPKGCSVSNIGAIRPHEGACTLRPVRPFPGASPVFPLTTNPSPTLPSRLAKPAPSQPPPTTTPKSKPKPKPLPRPPPLEKRSTEPISMKYGTPAGAQDEVEITEDYLDIVPDTTPEDVVDEGKKSTLSRGFPDGISFRRHRSEETLSSSAVTLDMDKTTVTKLLEDKLGVYILRKSENAQSKRALSVWTGDRVRHYIIFYEEKTDYTLDPSEGPYFENLEDLISHYHKHNLPKCDAKLLRPFKTKEEV